MVEIFYRVNGQMQVSQTEIDFSAINISDVVWIDLLTPTGEEKRAVEAFLGTMIQSRATAEEIESSSRFSETEDAIFANTNFVIPGPEEYAMETVSFILKGNVLTTLREVQLRSFTELQRRLNVFPKMYPNGFTVFNSILEQRIDSDADMIEILSKEISQYNKKVSLGEDINEEFLLDINRLQENTIVLRESIVDKQRVISSILKSQKCPKSIQNKLNIMLKDISSLVNHTNFSFDRLGSHQPRPEQDNEGIHPRLASSDAPDAHCFLLWNERCPADDSRRHAVELGHHCLADGGFVCYRLPHIQTQKNVVKVAKRRIASLIVSLTEVIFTFWIVKAL